MLPSLLVVVLLASGVQAQWIECSNTNSILHGTCNNPKQPCVAGSGNFNAGVSSPSAVRSLPARTYHYIAHGISVGSQQGSDHGKRAFYMHAHAVYVRHTCSQPETRHPMPASSADCTSYQGSYALTIRPSSPSPSYILDSPYPSVPSTAYTHPHP